MQLFVFISIFGLVRRKNMIWGLICNALIISKDCTVAKFLIKFF